jgi:cellobiose phosphorylase
VEPQCNWCADDDNRNLQYNQYIDCVESPAPGLIDIGSNVNMPEDPDDFTNKDQKRHTFFALSGIQPASYETDLGRFLGPYGTYAAPEAVRRGQCSGTGMRGDMPCGAFEIDVALAPGEELRFACIFGVGTAEEAGAAAVEQLADAGVRSIALEKVKAVWRERLDVLRVETPDAAFNTMANLWAPFNSLMTFYWSRAASLVYAGERDGLGYRDTLQDIVAAASLITDEARVRLELMLTGQYSNGGAKPVVQPFRHSPGEEKEPEAYRSDDTLWLFNAVPAYVNEAGDLDFYSKVLPFADQGEATVLGHLRKALDFNLERVGAHGLPCGLHADWNDCIRLGEKGESVFVAFQLRFGLEIYHGLCEKLEEPEEAAWAAETLADLDRRLEESAWDGEWYLRAYRYDGMKFGSRENDEGRIFMNPQSWAVLSGHATGERARQVMEAMHEHLNTDHGVMVCTPPYVNTDPEVCLARLMNPGMKENGGVFNHTQGWGVLALTELGMGDRAFEYLMNVLPASFNDRAKVREVEPYVVCQSTHSRFSPRFGAGRVSWLSGSATWNYAAMTQGVLGLKPGPEGLRIDPCLPSHWEGYTAVRRFRGSVLRIEVRNPQGRNKGVRRMTVDGRETDGNLVRVPAGNGEVNVIVEV